ncbi:MAG TPA: substrate-binding domain-containing protein [Thermodesulfobacteriota bacterium]|nr:substrate-binding domain-containing protein [Thermodesulfobacteriota bacterium]
MSEEMLNTKEVAKYLGIHEKQVYALIKSKKIPSTRVTGKWVFPKKIIDEWIESNAKTGLGQARQKSRGVEGGLLASGSNDPILDMLQTYMRKSYPEFYIFSANTGSTDGLKALNMGYTDIAWSHLFDPKSGEYNIPFLPNYLPNVKPVVINLFHRDLGFVVAPKNPFRIRGFEDLPQKGVRLINRQKGSGTRVLLDYHLKRLQISPSKINGYEREVYTHFEVGLSILSKEADVGIATIAVSKLLGLPFILITQENFDMILDQSTFFEKGIQAFIEILNSQEFRSRVERLGSYDFKNSGKVLYSRK